LICLGGIIETTLEAQNFGRVSVSVVDTKGEPIEGALIVITCSELESLHIEKSTNGKGKATLAFADATKVYNLHFEKEDFAPVDLALKPEVRQTIARTVTLVPKAVADSEADPNATPGGVVRFTPAEEAFNRGVTAIRANDLDTGKIAIMEALELDPAMAAGHAAMAGIYLVEKNFEAALQSAQTFQSLDPENAQVYRILYDAQTGLGNKIEADAALKALAEAGAGKDAAVMVYNEGVAALKIGSLAGAKSRFIDALAIQPEMVPALAALIAIYMDEEDYEKAIESTDRLLAVEPSNAKALQARYDALRAVGDEAGEKEAFDRLVAVDPKRAGAQFYEQGSGFFNAGDLNAAAEHFEKALAADPSLARAHYHLGLCNVNRGENAGALTHLKKFIEMAPDDADVPAAKEMLTYLGG
jgi:Tfp pilus assembly protein PilF